MCRSTGERPRWVELVDDHGRLERRSMVYTEHFARGTEPTSYCDLHPTRGIFGKIAGFLGGGDHPPPSRVEDAAPPPSPAVVPATGPASPVEDAPPAPKKKDGE
jgi:hypothetical protein